MKNVTARFTSTTDSTLSVFLKVGKRGITVGARLKTPGERTNTGAKTVFLLTDEAQATKRFDELRAEAVKQGWVVKQIESRVQSAFTEIPAAPKPADAPKEKEKKSNRKAA
jgi:hypothetical protein